MLLHHCLNFRAWTSVSSNSWNAQRQGGLSSDSNISQPSLLRPSDPDTWSPSLSGPDGIPSPARHSLNPGSLKTGPYVKIGRASWRSCFSPGFWNQSACWQVLFSSGLLVAKKVLHYQNKCLPRFQFHFVHWAFELWISDELPDLRTVKDASFQLLHGQSWKSLAQVSEAVTILVQSLGEEGRWCSFLCKAPIPPAKASPSLCNAEYCPYYPTCRKNEVLWLPTDPFLT